MLPFLDVLLERTTFLASVNRKPIFTGLHLSWDSFVPKFRKINLVKTLIVH